MKAASGERSALALIIKKVSPWDAARMSRCDIIPPPRLLLLKLSERGENVSQRSKEMVRRDHRGAR